MKIKHLLAWKLAATLLHCEYNVCYYNTSFVEDRLSGFRNAEPKLIISGTHGIKTGPKKMLPLFEDWLDCLYMWEERAVVGGGGLWCDLTVKNVVRVQGRGG